MLYMQPDRNACTIPLINGRNDEDLPEETIIAAERYELGRRYMLFGLHYAGYPWCFNTSGAAMAVKAEKYIKAGGMNTREAGEDFWFIRKLLPAGGFFNANNAIVYHSARISGRVPFGTGMAINELLTTPEKKQAIPDPELFDDLKTLWKGSYDLYGSTKVKREDFYSSLPDALKEFLPEEKFIKETEEISQNTASLASYSKRYFTRYDLLFAFRYLNFAGRRTTGRKNIMEACQILAHKAGFSDYLATTFSSALTFFRASEAWISCSPF